MLSILHLSLQRKKRKTGFQSILVHAKLPLTDESYSTNAEFQNVHCMPYTHMLLRQCISVMSEWISVLFVLSCSLSGLVTACSSPLHLLARLSKVVHLVASHLAEARSLSPWNLQQSCFDFCTSTEVCCLHLDFVIAASLPMRSCIEFVRNGAIHQRYRCST